MIAETNIWVLVDNNIPLFLSKGQELSTNKPYEVYNSVDSFLEKLEELSIDWEQPPIPEDPPNWDTFNTQMMSDTRFNQVYSQCLSSAPIVANALPTALDQVTTKGYSLFTIIWTQLCSIGGATADDKTVWGGYAEANNLPQEFITILVQ